MWSWSDNNESLAGQILCKSFISSDMFGYAMRNLKNSYRLYAVVRIADFRVINITAYIAYILFHSVPPMISGFRCLMRHLLLTKPLYIYRL